MPQGNIARGEKAPGINPNTPRALSLRTLWNVSRAFFFLSIVFLIVLACSQNGERERPRRLAINFIELRLNIARNAY